MRTSLIAGIILGILHAAAWSDTITLDSGRKMEAVVLQETPDAITVRLAYGTATIPRSQIQSIEKKPLPKVEAPKAEDATGKTKRRRIPPWSVVIERLASQSWAHNLQQIPATVIDTGVMANVPYISHRCGDDYEVNIYGDPDSPAGIEIGIYRELLKDPEAKQNCIDLIASVLPSKADRKIVRLLNLKEDVITRNGMTMEVTPPDAEDAYGGWWVSVYSEAALDKLRASKEELDKITVARATKKKTNAASENDAGGWTPGEMRRSRAPRMAIAIGGGSNRGHDAEEPTRSRDSVGAVGGGGGGRVYVRGYYRKNGTYVRPHTRRR